MPYDSNVLALQNTVNRFAVVAGTPKLSHDGFWGNQTATATRNVLSWVSRGSCTDDICVGDDDASTAAALLSQWNGSGSSAKGMALFLGRVADTLGLSEIAIPLVSNASNTASSAASVLLPLNQPSWLTKIVEGWKSLATWQKLGLGVLFGFGMLWLHKRYVRKG